MEVRNYLGELEWLQIGASMGSSYWNECRRTTVTLTMIYAGLVGSGIIGIIMSGGNNAVELKSNTQVLEQFTIPISIFAVILVIGLFAGGLTFLLSFLWDRKRFEHKLHQA